MKKQIALLTLALSLVLPAQAQYLMTRAEHADLNRNLENSMQVSSVVANTVTVQIPVTKQYFPNLKDDHIDFADSAQLRLLRDVPTYQGTVGCKAYALDDQWLIAGAVCLWNGRHPVYADGKKRPTGLTEPDFSKPLRVQGTEIPMEGNLFVQPHFTMLPHVILIRVPQNSPLAQTVKQMPKIHVLAITNINPVYFKEGSFYVNTSRFGLNVPRVRTLEKFDSTKKTVTIKESLDALRTLSNDPLLYATNGRVYWMGINNGIMVVYPNNRWDGQPSKGFVTFTNADIDFIRSVISQEGPAVWQRVAPRLHSDSVK